MPRKKRTLQDSFISTFSKAVVNAGRRLIATIIANKIAAQGITLTPEQRERLIVRIAAKTRSKKPGDSIRFSLPGKGNRSLNIAITPDDLAKLDALRSKAIDILPDIVLRSVDEHADSLLPDLITRWPDRQQYERARRAAFLAGLESRWSRAFERLAMFLTITRELAGEIAARRVPTTENAALLDTLMHLHARACQVTEEVLTLMRAGFSGRRPRTCPNAP